MNSNNPSLTSETLNRIIPTHTIRIIPISSIIIHEDVDPNRSEDVKEKILLRQYFTTPIIVTKPESSPYIHLDGANRIEACKRLNSKHILAQIVSLEGDTVGLEVWMHLLEVRLQKLISEGEKWKECRFEELRGAEIDREIISFEDRGLAAVLKSASGEVYGLFVNPDLGSRIKAINLLVDFYMSLTEIERAEALGGQQVGAQMDKALASTKNKTTCVFFSPFSKVEFVETIRDLDLRFPSGVTRFVLAEGRVIKFAVPFPFLRSAISLKDKNLQIEAEMESLKRRVYNEPIIFYE